MRCFPIIDEDKIDQTHPNVKKKLIIFSYFGTTNSAKKNLSRRETLSNPPQIALEVTNMG